MAINIKAKQMRQQVGSYAGQFRYQMAVEHYNNLDEDKVIEEAALRSGYAKGAIKAVWDAAGAVLKAWLTEGHCVKLPGIGSLRFGVNAKSVATVDEVSSGLIESRKVIFVPSSEIKDELANTAINITCYDKDGNVVKTTTDDSGNGTEAGAEG